MQIAFFCPRWGSESLSWDTFCSNVKVAGYDGVECMLPIDTEEKEVFLRALNTHQLKFIGQYYQSFEKNFELHKQRFEEWLLHLTSVQPVLIDAQTGKDYFTEEQNAILFDIAERVSKKTGVVIAHETHRNKALFAAHVAYKLLHNNKQVRITADFSHWCNVSESLLEDHEEAVALACDRAIHIHARVGYAQGPQINDPRAPEWAAELQAHMGWWDAIIQKRKKEGVTLFTITPEFGPEPYMPTLPLTKQPVTSQWEVNKHMMNLLKNRYANI
jgi:sugar phosphate isomerase/epimerase